MSTLRAIVALPFRLVMLAAGALSVGFLIIGMGAALVGDCFGGDHS